MVCIVDADTRFGPSYRQGYMTFGFIVHGDSSVSGHGPGVTPLLCGPAEKLQASHDLQANLANIFGVRQAAPAKPYVPLSGRSLSKSGLTGGRRIL
jgi:hypothetical protein